jgi:hypothetical protein
MAEPEKKPAEEPALVFPLSAPIRGYGEEITELRLRKPRARDVFEIGSMPVSINPLGATPDEQFVVDWRRLPQMLSRLASVPVKALDECDPSDIASLVLRMVNAGFFLPR